MKRLRLIDSLHRFIEQKVLPCQTAGGTSNRPLICEQAFGESPIPTSSSGSPVMTCISTEVGTYPCHAIPSRRARPTAVES